jgi:hypothetical protein
MLTSRKLLVPALAMLGLLAPATVAQAAPAVTCGATLTASVTLTQDLFCATPTGLTLGSGVILNLNGHLLKGPGHGIAVTVDPGGGRAVVKNGRISGWDAGVLVSADNPGSGATVAVRHLVLVGNGIQAAFANLTVDRVTLRKAGLTVFSARATVTRSTLDGGGITVGQSPGTTIENTRIADASVALSCVESVCSVLSSRFEHNTSGYRGFEARLTLTGNLFSDNGTGYQSSSNGPDLLERNYFRRNGSGVRLDAATQAVVRGNRFEANGTGIGSEQLTELPIGAFEVTLQDNVLVRNTDGILLPDDFLPPVTGFSLGGNRAFNNVGHGIFAPRSVDLGGNVAHGNGIQPQCVGVVCG